MKRAEKVKHQRTVILAIASIIVALLLIASVVYVMFFKQRICPDIQCFQEASKECFRFQYTNEDVVATWKYEILGKSGDNCKIRVTLINAKSGELGIDKLAGKQMDCYTQGAVSYPEKDLSMCHGILKEDLLNIIITKLHGYIIDNLGKVETGIENFG